MAKFVLQPSVKFEIVVTLTETEARALEALAGYGVDAFIEHFYVHLGRSYMEPHEQGLRTFLTSVQESMAHQLHKVDNSRQALAEK